MLGGAPSIGVMKPDGPRSTRTRDVEVVGTVDKLRARLRRLRPARIGLVPTMGALHAGHFSLIKRSARECDFTLISVFVNPLQFDDENDFANYPRDLAIDAVAAGRAGADLVFAPSPDELIPAGDFARIDVGDLENRLCGRFRPGHFAGVAAIVSKFFNIVGPDRAYFGEKDWQQLIIVKKLVKDANLGLKVISVPTEREPDGLAISSRNIHLSAGGRQAAPSLFQALICAKKLISGGEERAERIIARCSEVIARQPGVELEYFSICEPETLVDVETIRGPVLIAGVIRIGETRLIDNMVVKR